VFGDVRMPPIHPVAHHYTHALHACLQSPFERSICLTIDGSGDEHTTVLWRHEGERVTPLREIRMPHSLGWVYAAFTEYLGFKAYDGEYKVMGLAAYGRPNDDLRARIGRIVTPAPDGIEFRVDPTCIHYGAHRYSDRYTDKLIEIIGRPPRLAHEEITAWHEDLAFAVQENLERTVERLALWAVRETGIPRLCIGGGVGLNVKMNSRLFLHPEIEDVFAQPLCSDGGAAAGVALAACFERTGARPERLETLALGLEESNETIEKTLTMAHLRFERPDDICEAVADELAKGRIVGWFQGRMEAGPRALGQRSILADPRAVANRDKVNSIVKFREYWRPFCPSMTAEAAPRYFDRFTDAPFMIIAFPANERLAREAPAIVHVDGTSRVQLVKREVNPRYHRLLTAFERRTGVPVLLNTSYNVKGEPIVCTIHDALRTFWATGLEVLAAGDFLLRKPALAPA
jgi:carbamoyltransferase